MWHENKKQGRLDNIKGQNYWKQSSTSLLRISAATIILSNKFQRLKKHTALKLAGVTFEKI